MISTMVSNGANIAIIAMNNAAMNSTALTIGLAKPPVVAVEAALVATVPTCTVPATPPPAINEMVHIIMGDISLFPILAAVMANPAIAAEGVAMVSSKLSNQGTK